MHTPANERWSLGAKLAAVGLPFLLLGLLTTALTLWVSWQLDGGAAAVNEAGRLRMQAYRLAWADTRTPEHREQRALQQELDNSLQLLAQGDPDRPLVMPWDDEVRQRFAQVLAAWQALRSVHRSGPSSTRADQVDAATHALSDRIDHLVNAMEGHLASYTSVLHLLQVGLLVLGTMAASVLVVVGYHFVLEPVAGLKQAVSQLQGGDLSARVDLQARDELGALAAGFNDMAERLQASYTGLEEKVREKTAELQDQRERLAALYDVSQVVAGAASVPEMATAFTQRVRGVARADAAALRWADAAHAQFVLLASEGMPAAMVSDEHCIRSGECLCGRSTADGSTRVIPIHAVTTAQRPHCEQAGWTTVVAVPLRLHERLLGELNLFFHAEVSLPTAERALLESLCSQLAGGMENLRLQALEREAAVAEERGFLARELHDSIAQSLAFLNIQAQLMRKAMAEADPVRMAAVMNEIELGLHESHGDVRELLLHFRTRTNAEDIEHALQTTLQKFRHQSGIEATLVMHGSGLPLDPDLQVQALHIVQEALSNVRKHADARHVGVQAWRQPCWRFEVRDDGSGFDTSLPAAETHIGLRIMRERAQRLGAELQLQSAPGRGTVVTLTLPARQGLTNLPAPAPATAHA